MFFFSFIYCNIYIVEHSVHNVSTYVVAAINGHLENKGHNITKLKLYNYETKVEMKTFRTTNKRNSRIKSHAIMRLKW